MIASIIGSGINGNQHSQRHSSIHRLESSSLLLLEVELMETWHNLTIG